MCFNFQFELRNENLYDRFSHHTIVSVRRNSFRGKLRNAKKIRRNYMFGMKPLTTMFGLASKFKHVRPFCAMYFHQNCPFLHHIRQQYYELCFLKFFGRLSSCRMMHDLELFADKNNCCSRLLKSWLFFRRRGDTFTGRGGKQYFNISSLLSYNAFIRDLSLCSNVTNRIGLPLQGKPLGEICRTSFETGYTCK